MSVMDELNKKRKTENDSGYAMDRHNADVCRARAVEGYAAMFGTADLQDRNTTAVVLAILYAGERIAQATEENAP